MLLFVFQLVHEKFFVMPSVYFVTRILIDSKQHVIQNQNLQQGRLQTHVKKENQS